MNLYGVDVLYGTTLRDVEAAHRSMETQLRVPGLVNMQSLTGRTPLAEVREALDRLNNPEDGFEDRIHVIAASSMLSHGVYVDRWDRRQFHLGWREVPPGAAVYMPAASRRLGR